MVIVTTCTVKDPDTCIKVVLLIFKNSVIIGKTGVQGNYTSHYVFITFLSINTQMKLGVSY